MATTNFLVYVRVGQTCTGYNNIGGTGGVKLSMTATRARNVAFRIREIVRHQGQVWVRSDAFGWAPWSNNRFEDASCHLGTRIYLSPSVPAVRDGFYLSVPPPAGTIYAPEFIHNSGWYLRHIQPRV